MPFVKLFVEFYQLTRQYCYLCGMLETTPHHLRFIRLRRRPLRQGQATGSRSLVLFLRCVSHQPRRIINRLRAVVRVQVSHPRPAHAINRGLGAKLDRTFPINLLELTDSYPESRSKLLKVILRGAGPWTRRPVRFAPIPPIYHEDGAGGMDTGEDQAVVGVGGEVHVLHGH